jgi:O-antigen/teichoic acid export membrane protein
MATSPVAEATAALREVTADATSQPNLKRTALRGGVVVVSSQAAKFILRLGSLMILARILSPKDFGIVGMVTSVTGVLGLLGYAGLSLATVQSPKITQAQLSALFWVNMALGVLLGLVTVACAPALVAFYHEPRLVGVAIGIGLSFVFNAATIQHQAVLQRQLRFGAIAIADVIALVASNAVAILIAVKGFGFWALIAQTLGCTIFSVVTYWIALPWRPGLPERNSGVWSLVKFGGVVTINSITMYLAYNADKIFLGRYWGAESLGLYGRAYQLVNLPMEQLHSSIGTVAFSALPRLQMDAKRIARNFLAGYALVLSMTVPLTTISAVFAPDVVAVALGPKWQGVALIFQLLSPAIFVFGLINPFGWLLISSGQAVKSMKIGFVIVPVVILAYLCGLPFGPNGVAASYSLAMLLLTVPLIAWFRAGSALTGREIFDVVKRPVLAAVAAAIVGVGFNLVVAGAWTPLLRLCLGTALTGLVYLVILIFFMNQKEMFQGLLKPLLARAPRIVA